MNNHDEEALEKLRKGGKILREAREEIRRFVREGLPIIEMCERAEKLLRQKGGRPAFPCNVSVNEIAAHYTSPPKDQKIIPKNCIVKVDIGVHIDGYITDTAITVSFDPEYRSLVEAAEEALEAAIKIIRPGISTSKIGGTIEKAIKSRGFKPISNLTGHKIGRYLLHAGTSLPNVSHLSFSKVKLGEVYAIEPFSTLSNAIGKVENSKEVTIFRFLKHRPTKDAYAKQLMKYIEKNFRTLPFAERWLQGVVPREDYSGAFNELLSSKSLMSYPVFIEASGKPVAQAEHTVLIVEDGCIVLT